MELNSRKLNGNCAAKKMEFTEIEEATEAIFDELITKSAGSDDSRAIRE